MQSNYSPYRTFIIQGDRLTRLLQAVDKFPFRRNFYVDLDDFIASKTSPEVLLLYGVRRTGKTTAMLQAILHLPEEERQKAVFFQVRKSRKTRDCLISGDTVQDIQEDIGRLLEEGKKYFFVDEATRLIDFQYGADVFADVLAMSGGKIVLSGTDSLCLDDARKDALLGRAISVNTSHIFFAEWSDICGSDSVDDFAKYGGILGNGNQIQQIFGSPNSCEEYVQSAYAQNLEHSISERKYTNIPDEILDLADEKRLESVLQRIIENLNHRVTAKILRKQLSLSSIGSLRDLIKKDVIRARDKNFSVAELLSKKIQLSTLQGINEEQIVQWMSLCLHIRDEHIFLDNKTIDGFLPISQEAAAYLERELIRLDILVPFTVRKIYDDGSVIDSKKNLLVQHGLKFCQETAMADCLTNDPVFATLFKSDKDSLLHRMEQDILGHIIEEIILLDTQKSFENSDAKVFTLGLPKGEIDLAILDKKTKSIALFEIKHSSVVDPDHQTKYLKDGQTLALIKKAFGGAEIVGRNVLINSNTIESECVGEIHYQSVRSFLKDIVKDPFKAVFRNN